RNLKFSCSCACLGDLKSVCKSRVEMSNGRKIIGVEACSENLDAGVIIRVQISEQFLAVINLKGFKNIHNARTLKNLYNTEGYWRSRNEGKGWCNLFGSQEVFSKKKLDAGVTAPTTTTLATE
ncbi:Hypothetical predicted protein, partial [Pelobates cultripes]